MSITSGVGLISGIDFESMIAKISQASRGPINLIQRKQAVLNAKSEAYGAVSTQLSALRDQLKGMLSESDFTFRSTNSSNSDILDITASDTASLGNYGVKVLQLAQAERIASQGVAAADTAIIDGGFVPSGPSDSAQLILQVGDSSTLTAVEITASMTLTEIRDAINQDSDSEVSANIVNDGSSTNSYRLILTSKKTGAANDVNIIRNNTTLDFTNTVIEEAVAAATNAFNGTVTSGGAYTGSGSLNVILKTVVAGDLSGTPGSAAEFVVSTDGGLSFGATQYQADSSTPFAVPGADGVTVSFAPDAAPVNMAVGDSFNIDVFDPNIATAADGIITVDGIQIRRDSNTFSDVAEGVSFTAKSVSATETVTASISAEPGMVSAKMMEFQGAFNNVIEIINATRQYDEESRQAQPLFGDSSVRSIYNSLKRIATNPIQGIDSQYNTLASMGMKFQADGTLGFDLAKANDAIGNDLSSLMKVFGQIGDSTSSQIQFVDSSSKTAARDFNVEVISAATRASIDGTALAGTLSGAEELTFTVGENTFAVSLADGSDMDAIVTALNARFSTEEVGLEAINQSGALRLQTTQYGSEETFTLSSDGAQMGFAAGPYTLLGSDVVATIDGKTATGAGQTLRGMVGTTAEGLILEVTASGPTSGTVTFSRGVADQMLDLLEGYLDSETGIIDARQNGISKSITNMNEQIETLESRIEHEGARMRKKFIAMETQLAQYQGLGDYVTNALAQLGGNRK